jgi:hypothetical protein
MAGYRTHEGQHSDRAPIRRTAEQKKVLLRQLKEQMAELKPWVAANVRESLAKRIAELEKEVGRG